MSDPVAFLQARYDGLEAVARVAEESYPSPWSPAREGWDAWTVYDRNGDCLFDTSGGYEGGHEQSTVHIALHDPAAVLAGVRMRRGILELHWDINDGDCATCVVGRWGYPVMGGSNPSRWPCPTVRLLLGEFAGHPDFEAGWEV